MTETTYDEAYEIFARNLTANIARHKRKRLAQERERMRPFIAQATYILAVVNAALADYPGNMPRQRLGWIRHPNRAA